MRLRCVKCDSPPFAAVIVEFHISGTGSFDGGRKGSTSECTRILESKINYGVVCFVIGKSELCETIRRRDATSTGREYLSGSGGCAAALCVNLLVASQCCCLVGNSDAMNAKRGFRGLAGETTARR